MKSHDLTAQNLRDLLFDSMDRHGDLTAIGFLGKDYKSYGVLKSDVEQFAFCLTQQGLIKGDRIGLLGNNSPQWVTAYFTILSMGMVAVPVLPDFHTGEIEHIFKHGEVKALMITAKQFDRFGNKVPEGIELVIRLDDFARLRAGSLPDDQDAWIAYEPQGSYNPRQVEIHSEDLASLIYTSGTTGFSKGVMLTHGNLVENIRQCYSMENLAPGHEFISILPLSHTLENTVGCLLPLSFGSTIHYLEKPPTASVLVDALKKVRPTHMLSVPLVIEKIYKSQVMGKVNKSKLLSRLYTWPPFRRFFHRLAGKKLMATFGSRLQFFGIGGARLDESTERFLMEAKFPYAIGYGLTETAPLISGAGPAGIRYRSAGKPVTGVEMQIHEPDAETGIGEIWARGKNVMQGYYNEPGITSQVLTKDGWFRTGDLGMFDQDGFLYILGRLKNVIIGPSGENIYPEEIESVINRFHYVVESVVVQRTGKLVALVHFNTEELEKQFAHFKEEARLHVEKKVEELKQELEQFVNSRVNRFSKIQMVMIQVTPFEKTATKKIKRFLYASQA